MFAKLPFEYNVSVEVCLNICKHPHTACTESAYTLQRSLGVSTKTLNSLKLWIGHFQHGSMSLKTPPWYRSNSNIMVHVIFEHCYSVCYWIMLIVIFKHQTSKLTKTDLGCLKARMIWCLYVCLATLRLRTHSDTAGVHFYMYLLIIWSRFFIYCACWFCVIKHMCSWCSMNNCVRNRLSLQLQQ